jgi:hypothetical protein
LRQLHLIRFKKFTIHVFPSNCSISSHGNLNTCTALAFFKRNVLKCLYLKRCVEVGSLHARHCCDRRLLPFFFFFFLMNKIDINSIESHSPESKLQVSSLGWHILSSVVGKSSCICLVHATQWLLLINPIMWRQMGAWFWTPELISILEQLGQITLPPSLEALTYIKFR